MCTSTVAVETFRELSARGMTRTQVRRALSDGDLRRVRRGVYAGRDACDDAVTAAAHGGALACLSAARHLGLWVLSTDDAVHVWLGAGGHRRHEADDGGRCGCVEHWDRGPRREFALPSVRRILRQILACRGVEEFFVALESARRKRLIGPGGLQWLAAHTNLEGREAIRLSRDDADSGLESLLRWRLRRHGLTVRTQVHITGVGDVDILIGDRLIIEADGKENHDDESHRHKDLVRDANAAMWGYASLRFDYAMIVHDWELVEAAILGAVAAGRHLQPAR